MILYTSTLTGHAPYSSLCLVLSCASQGGGLGAVILLEMITLAVCTWLFLSPLEAMGKRIRAGQRIDIGRLVGHTRLRP